MPENQSLISYCGLYCGHCFSRTHIAPTATKLKDYMKRQGFETFGPYMPNFKEFWEFTTVLIDAEGCPGCGKNGGNSSCAGFLSSYSDKSCTTTSKKNKNLRLCLLVTAC
jgi:hypothetical protein